jgi:glycosyltransferase involved in cell wall biosynthesis
MPQVTIRKYPMVSVLMSVYNGECYLREAVESILQQTFIDFEFVIINDGSTDSTQDILAEYATRDQRIVLVQNKENIGLTKSLNKWLRIVRGKYIARQDADDVSLPERLMTQVRYLERLDHVGLLGTAYYMVDCQERPIATHRLPLADTEIRWQMLFHSAFCHPSVMFRQELLDKSKPFYNEDLLYSQDYDLWTRLQRRTCVANLDVPMLELRVHDCSISTTHYEEQQRIASKIAAQQINTLIPQRLLTESEVDTLRRWYNRFPQRLSKQDMVLCRTLLRILDAFGKQPNVDPEIVRDIRRRRIGRILAAISKEHLLDLWGSGLLWDVLRNYPSSVLAHTSKRAIRRIRRVLQLTEQA